MSKEVKSLINPISPRDVELERSQQQMADFWYARWGVNRKKLEVAINDRDKTSPDFERALEIYQKVAAEERLMEYAAREYEEGRGLTITEFLRC